MHQPHANSHIAAHMIAAAERHAADIAYIEQMRLTHWHDGGVAGSRRGIRLSTVRDAIGLSLIPHGNTRATGNGSQ